MDYGAFFRSMINDKRRFTRMGFDRLTGAELEEAGRWLSELTAAVGAIIHSVDEVRAGGHIVTLLDGSRREVDEADSDIVDGWLPGDDVIVGADRMYRVDEHESAQVTPFD